MCSVGVIRREIQTKFIIEKSGDNLVDNHMAKIIRWVVMDFKMKYPLLFIREYVGDEGLSMNGMSF